MLDQVSFTDPGAATPALDRISLAVTLGQVIGVVGRSGSGKTTLTRLTQGIENPQAGLVQGDGVDIRQIDLEHLRRSLGVVLEDRRRPVAPPVLSSGQGSVIGVFAILCAALLIVLGQRDVHHLAIGRVDGDGFLGAVSERHIGHDQIRRTVFAALVFDARHLAGCGRMDGHVGQLDRPGPLKLSHEIGAFIGPQPGPGEHDNAGGPKLRRSGEAVSRHDQFLDRLPAGIGTAVLHLGARRNFGLRNGCFHVAPLIAEIGIRSSGSGSFTPEGQTAAPHSGRITLTGTLTNLLPGTVLLPGMTLTADIKSGTRTVLDDFLEPLMRGLNESLRKP